MMMIVIGKVAIVVFVVWGVYFLACHVRDKNMTKKEKKIADEKIYLEVKEKLDKDASDANDTWSDEDESQLMTWTKEDGEKSMQNEDFGNTKFIEHSTPKKKKSEQKVLATEIQRWKGYLDKQAKSLIEPKKKRKHKTRYLPINRKRYRKSFGWTQVIAAREIGCAPSTISELENNDVDSKTAVRYDFKIYWARKNRKSGSDL